MVASPETVQHMPANLQTTKVRLPNGTSHNEEFNCGLKADSLFGTGINSLRHCLVVGCLYVGGTDVLLGYALEIWVLRQGHHTQTVQQSTPETRIPLQNQKTCCYQVVQMCFSGMLWRSGSSARVTIPKPSRRPHPKREFHQKMNSKMSSAELGCEGFWYTLSVITQTIQEFGTPPPKKKKLVPLKNHT